jgi:lipid-A-disaccharide synthase-like uncharacterized protein
MDAIRPRWTTTTFLVYSGVLVLSAALAGWASYLASNTGPAADTLWSFLLLVVLAAIAEATRRAARPITAGVFAFAAVAAFAAFLSTLFDWFGWTTRSSESFQGFHLSRLLIELLWGLAALAALRRFAFPLLVLQVALAGWVFVTDLLSGGGTWSAILSILVGLVYLLAAVVVDGSDGSPYAFWLHVAAGAIAGGGVLAWLGHHGSVAWFLIAAASVAYIRLAWALRRSSWAVLGVIGLFIASDRFVLHWTHLNLFFIEGAERSRPWVPPLVFTCMGLLVVGLALARRRSTGLTES